MYRHPTPSTAGQKIRLPALTLLLLILLWPFEALQAVIPDQKNQMLQFSAAGHVLGFETSGVYIGGGDHLLHVGFVGTPGVTPEAAGVVDDNGRAAPLARITYPGLWPGINLRCDATAGGITQSTWEIAAGAPVGQIRLRYNVPVTVMGDGSLRIDLVTGRMHESAPVAWQVIDGRRYPVEVSFTRLGGAARETLIGFEVGHHDPAHPLVIDPTLEWNTFMGSKGNDSGFAIAVDGKGNAYVAGRSEETWGKPLNAHAGGYDAFVARLSSSGQLVWHTFMGARGYDEASAIAVYDDGSVYVAGRSDATWGTPVNLHAGIDEAFVARLSPKGERLWHTFMGSSHVDSGNAIAVDGSGNAYVAGFSGATWGRPVNAFTSDAFGIYEAFVTKLDAKGTRIWNTFMGSSSEVDYGTAIAVLHSDDVVVAGYSFATWGKPVTAHAGSSDAFVARLNDSGVRLWNTFMGSSDDDKGTAIAADGSVNLSVAGISRATWGMPVDAFAGGITDAFIARLDASGALVWNTFLGSSGSDYGHAITVDNSGGLYVTGYSDDTWGIPVNAHAGNWDAFIVKLHTSGARLWNSFMGSLDSDLGLAITVDGSGSVHVAGESESTWGTPVNPHTGGFDVFAARVRLDESADCSFYIIKTQNGKAFAVCL